MRSGYTPPPSLLITLLIIISCTFLLTCENPLIQKIWDLRTITFDTGGGSHVPSQKLLKGYPVARPSDPVRSGYFFTGWYEDDTTTTLWDFNTVPDGDVTLYAGWESIGPVIALSLKTPPKLIYTHNDNLDLSGLVVTLTYGANHNVDVPFSQFASNDLTVSINSGTPLSRSTNNGDVITVLYNGSTPPFTVSAGTITVNPIVVTSIVFPTASSIKEGQTLADSVLTGGSIEHGSFAWDSLATEPPVGTANYDVVFTPTDTTNYDYSGVSGWNPATERIVRGVSVTVTSTAGSIEITLSIDPIEEKANILGTGFTYNSEGRYYTRTPAIVLSRTGTASSNPPNEATISVTLPDGVTNPRWTVQGVGAYSSQTIDVANTSATSCTIKADLDDPEHVKYCVPGFHALKLTVTADGKDYDVNIQFEIQ